VKSVSTLEFDVTLDDLVESNVWHAWHSPAVPRQVLQTRLLVTVGAILALLASAYLSKRGVGQVNIAIAVFVAAVIFAAYPWTVQRTMRKNIRKYYDESRDAETGPRRWEIEENGLRDRHGGSSSLHKWRDLGPIDETPDYVFIYEGEQGGLVIPKSGVRQPDALEPFLAEVRERIS